MTDVLIFVIEYGIDFIDISTNIHFASEKISESLIQEMSL